MVQSFAVDMYHISFIRAVQSYSVLVPISHCNTLHIQHGIYDSVIICGIKFNHCVEKTHLTDSNRLKARSPWTPGRPVLGFMYNENGCSRRRHEREAFSASLTFCAWNQAVSHHAIFHWCAALTCFFVCLKQNWTCSRVAGNLPQKWRWCDVSVLFSASKNLYHMS